VSQVTLNLPNTLYHQLEIFAQNEGVSLPEYIVYALTYQIKSAYTVHVLPKEATSEQQIRFSELLKKLGQAPASEIQEVLEEREVVEREAGLDQETMKRLHTKLSLKSS
jgi:hypothetical protein